MVNRARFHHHFGIESEDKQAGHHVANVAIRHHNWTVLFLLAVFGGNSPFIHSCQCIFCLLEYRSTILYCRLIDMIISCKKTREVCNVGCHKRTWVSIGWRCEKINMVLFVVLAGKRGTSHHLSRLNLSWSWVLPFESCSVSFPVQMYAWRYKTSVWKLQRPFFPSLVTFAHNFKIACDDVVVRTLAQLLLASLMLMIVVFQEDSR